MQDIGNELQRCWEQTERAVMATIIEIDGTAYRREGARCLITETGKLVGTLSGGCVEADLFEHARDVLQLGAAKQLRYDFRLQEDLLWGLGVGCNGAITIFLQPFDPLHAPQQAEQMLHAFQKRITCRTPYLTGTVVNSDNQEKIPLGSELVITDDADEMSAVPEKIAGLESAVWSDVEVTLFVETVNPLPRLVVFGAGQDAVPLVRAAKTLHWHVTIVDHRQAHLKQKDFREADERVCVLRDQYSQCSLPDESFVVIMTHSYELDRLLVRHLLPRSFPYLGVLGSQQRNESMLQEIKLEGVSIPETLLDKLHFPIGLDIGAETPEEIALSILAELQAKKNGRTGQPLKFRNQPMHIRNKKRIASLKKEEGRFEPEASRPTDATCRRCTADIGTGQLY